MADFVGRFQNPVRIFSGQAQKDKVGRLIAGQFRTRPEPEPEPDAPIQPIPYAIGAGGDIAPISLCLDGLAQLMDQYAESPILRAWICSALAELQGAEDDTAALRQEVLSIPDAIGAQLDIIGRIVGEPRGGRSDASYRLALRVRVQANKSNGRIEELIAIVLSWADLDPDTSGQVYVHEFYPAGQSYTPRTATEVSEPYELHKRLRQAKGGGIDLVSVHLPGGVAGSFRFSPAYDTPSSSDLRGWGSTYASVGGVIGAGFR